MASGVKICVACGADVSQTKRVKDDHGDYYCHACWADRNKASAGESAAPTDDLPGDVQEMPSDQFGCPICGGTFSPQEMDASGVCKNCAHPPEVRAATGLRMGPGAKVAITSGIAAVVIVLLVLAGLHIKSSVERGYVEAVLALKAEGDKAVVDQDWQRAVEKYDAMIQMADDKHLDEGALESELADARAALKNARTQIAKLQEEAAQQAEAQERMEQARLEQDARAEAARQREADEARQAAERAAADARASAAADAQARLAARVQAMAAIGAQARRAAETQEVEQERTAEAARRIWLEEQARARGGLRPHGSTEADPIDRAVADGVSYLYGQIASGNAEKLPAADPKADRWSVRGAGWGGLTSLSVLALLVAGEKPTDPRLAPAIDWLRHAEFRGTYATALRAQVWSCLPLTPENRAYIRHDADTLVNSLQSGAHADGMYNYFVKSDPMSENARYADAEPAPRGRSGAGFSDGWYDHSNSQLGVLGVWALAETNAVEIPAWYWQTVHKGWTDAQYQDGAWSYRNDPASHNVASDSHTFSMTASGVATLYITEDYLWTDTGCTGNLENASILAGVKWLGDNFDGAYRTTSPGGEFMPPLRFYAVYAMERVGQASGRKYLGTIDWFKTGAAGLINMQGVDGGWGQVPDTGFAMLFLCHGRAPIAFNKLEYHISAPGDPVTVTNWDERPRDAANISRWVGHAEELEFRWQIVNLEVPATELHDAPILYISGNQSLSFTPEDEIKLKQFVEEGGLILFNADCGSDKFSKSAERLGTRLFPGLEFRVLPENHPIYTDEQFPRARWSTKPEIKGLSNGARELMLLVPRADPARYWQARTVGGREEFHFLGADIFQYAVTSPQLLKRDRTFIVTPQNTGGGAPVIKIARLKYPGVWDPEPGGWRRLAAIMHNQGWAELAMETVNLGEGKLAGYQVAHLTGTYATTLPDAARAEIKDFVARGGTLIIDACGGSPLFGASMEDELAAMFTPAAAPAILKADHPVFSTANKIGAVEYRRYAAKTLKNLTTPRLRGVEIKGRTAVFLSDEDLSVGLVGVPVDGVYGYEPASAVSLMENMLFYATGYTPHAVPTPTTQPGTMDWRLGHE